jgi:UDP-xylose/UDP-N-acetylglucosamine transporter B4
MLSTGLLITLSQFIFTALAASFSQITPTLALKTPAVPMRKWGYIALMFFGVNMLNNWAFAFNISVPVHIILRSFGSVTTMLAGALQGKRFSLLQVGSVVLLTLGVLVSAFADADSKVHLSPHPTLP